MQVRLAQVMLDLTYRFGQETEAGLYDLHLELRHEEIASLAHASRVSATQAISAWRVQEIVLGTRGHYRVNVGHLERLMRNCNSMRCSRFFALGDCTVLTDCGELTNWIKAFEVLGWEFLLKRCNFKILIL